ncbi:MAG: hypothetical protein Q7T48_08270 [Cellvibrio sp.]|uniref:hypothetical protein n=1 Tax=Cellvibrio sp. TaxID=1965322 RepID=UPI00272910C9|nr:hypothetical protein [Cellvibrio sp.]
MSRLFLNLVIWTLCICCVSVNAQLLPDNKSLNAQSVARWMQTNRAIAPIVQVVDSMNATDAVLKAFEALPPAEQDQKINALLKSKNLLENANQITQKHGWKSVGEYMRLSTKLGNAIAAYFLFGDLGKVTGEQEKQLKEKADPAVLAVPQIDIDFVKKNEKALQKYIQAYGAGR